MSNDPSHVDKPLEQMGILTPPRQTLMEGKAKQHNERENQKMWLLDS